jgi:hypothetical protein
VQEPDEKDPTEPDGRPETLKETAWLLPEPRVAVTLLDADDPAATETSPELASEKPKETTGVLTVSVNAVVLVKPPPADVTVIGKLPAGVDPLVLMVSVEEQVGLQEAEEKDLVAPEGSPETLKETSWPLPELRVAVMLLDDEEPAVTETLPELASEKSKDWVTVRKALASELSAYPLLKAFAFTVVLLVKLSGPA